MIKKMSFILCIFLCTKNIFAISLDELLEAACSNNSDIESAQKVYDSSLISSKTLDAAYAPSVSLSSASTLPDRYSWDTIPNYFSSTLTYSQPLSGGTSLGLSGSYSFNATDILEQRYISQLPNISISITQSLLPFWAQGRLKDPSKLSFQQKKQYYYNQLLYAKKTVIQTLVQYYAYAIIFKNKAEIYENSISLLNEQIDILNKLKETGNTNQAKITELESSTWSYQEDLASVQNSYVSYIQNVKTLCGMDFDEKTLEDICEMKNSNISNIILGSIGTSTDPLEQNYKLELDMQKNSRVLEKQNYAPTISLSVQPSWTLDTTTQDEWKEVWKNMDSPSSWSVSVSVNLSPLISGVVKQNKKQFNLDYDLALKTYKSYLKQKAFVQSQYEALFKQYTEQTENASKIYQESLNEIGDYEKQYKEGAVSRLDYDSVKIRIENARLSKKCMEMYSWMYKNLMNMN